jgi:hypothetical protein
MNEQPRGLGWGDTECARRPDGAHGRQAQYGRARGDVGARRLVVVDGARSGGTRGREQARRRRQQPAVRSELRRRRTETVTCRSDNGPWA